ncbi:centrosome-associated protein 350 isoform X2 [Sander lucioperca]|uniref:centrosome-associated protein 350 isoform X2 n=1 Tax=Sander lucioperca TaxID=283035 RepID=UPI00125E010A|nr:centrosome-associated protein 350 isoform X2 [Sander lucioperca]
MREMRSSRRTEVSGQQLTDHNIGTELTTAWKSLSQSKAALRHIENRLEAAPGTGVLLDSVMDLPKKKSSRTIRCRDGQQADDSRGSSKRRGRSQQSPDKSSSRSPLRNATQDSNVRRNNSVEFREPLVSYREATPPPHPSSQLEAYSLQSVPGSSYQSSPPPSDPLLSQLVYQRDTRDKQADRDLDSTHSSALENTEVRYLNDQPALDTLRTIGNQSHLTGVRVHAWERAEEKSTLKAQLGMDSQESSPSLAPAPGSIRQGESTPSTSPGSASQRLENLRRHQPDDKLEKLKERIRRQRQHLEEAAEKEKLLGYLEQPIMAAVGSNNAGTSNMPTAIIRKVAAAPPAPIYKGFNSTETKIRTPDGRVWKEEQFHNLSKEIYSDLSRQFAETTRSRHQQQREQRADRLKERRPPKPVRKVHRAAPSSDLNAKPVISPASWREGQKLVKMVLGPVPKLPREKDRPQPADRLSRTASRHRSSSDPRSESNPQPRPNSTERPRSGFKSKNHSTTTSPPSSTDRDQAPVGVSTDLLSADIKGILDDLQLECKAAEGEERARQRSRGGSSARRGRGGSGSRKRTPVSVWGTTVTTDSSSRGCRSVSPTAHRPETTDSGHKKRHYDADTVRQYISRQQEERKRRQAEEKRALKEEAERRNQRLQELYRKQREVAKTMALPSEVPVAPVQKRLQETYNKLLLEEAQLGEEATQMLPVAPSSQMRPMYQPSGESDKENKRLEAPQSPSSSDRSLNDRPSPPLSRNDLDIGVTSLLQPDRLSPAVRPMTGPSSSGLAPFGDHLLSRLLRLETAVAASDVKHTPQPATASFNRPQSKMSRIEALKATAASLSNRIESEARKLAGEGLNYGTETSMDVDTIRPSQANLNDGCWAETAATENDDVALRIQRILTSTGHSSYNGTALPGVGNLHVLRGHKENKGTHTNLTYPQTTSVDVTGPILNNYTHERRRLVNGLEKDKNRTELHDSSAGSISEGPLLSEGSFSEDDPSPPHPSNNRVPVLADRLEAMDYCAGQRRDYQRLSEFQREAARCTALSPPFAQHDGSKAAWEELNKGSPLSVINIFTKNLHGHVTVSERNSPSAHSIHSGNGPIDTAIYEDDFVSSHSSRASGQLRRSSNSHSVNSHFEELMRRSPYDKSTGGINSHHSSFQLSSHSPHLSPASTSGSSPFSKRSTRKRGTASDQSDATLVEEQRSSCSPPSEALSSDSRKRGSDKSSVHSQAKSVYSNDTIRGTSGLSHQSKKSPAARPKQSSPSGSPYPGSPPGAGCPSEPGRIGSLEANYPNTGTTARSGRAETKTTGELQYSPAVLQQRMAAELQYLESIEESVRQLGDVERVMGVSMAQQESVTLAQMLKARQQCHEHDLYELKIKAEREALETQLQLEENRQRVARAHIELQENLAANQKETLEGLQEATTKMMSQQAEAARYTADTARHIKEMTELARSQIAGALVVPPAVSDSSILDKREEQQSSYSEQLQEKNDSDSFPSEVSSRRTRPEEPLSSLNSLSHSDSLSFRRPNLSGADSSSHHSPSRASTDPRERTKKEAVEGKLRKGGAKERTEREAGSSSIEEEVLTAANDSLCSDSIPSVVDEKGDSTSVATEYSLKFDESMTEDEIEERSFRSLLPSEAHRRGTMEKKSRHHEESEDDGANHDTTLVSGAHNILKSQDGNMAFSSGQDSFSQFTMDMVRQYMKDEEVRLQHQSSLLHLRQKAVKEKTRTELAWLEHQKKRLRDKGEDDKMPPIRKKQRGLLMKLQQEQAEIKRLQEANKAARKERQLLLKQQEEIERMRNSTFRLKERLKCSGGEAPPETPVSETPVSEAASSNMRHVEDIRSPSPSLSVSGSETSSIMQKLKKMRSHMDEKHCSPVHYFFSVFTAHHWASLSVCLPNLHPKFQLFIYNQLVRFLTKREQQLMQRRHHAEELLQWKLRLDQEEAEVRRMEKEALAVWDRQTPQDMAEGQEKEIPDISPNPSHHRSSEPRTDSEKDYVSEGDCSSATPESSIHTEGLGSQQPGSPSSLQPASVPETPLASVQSSPANYTQDFTSASRSPSKQSLQSPLKGSHSSAASPSDGSSKTKMQLCSSSRTANHAHTQPAESPMQTEPISDQSDIESRIKALKEELRKRKFMAYQLKKEQKKRNKERLKAQEASLLKQLESYNNFIEKTKAELNKEPDSTPDTQSQIKDSTSIAEQSSIKPPAHRSETSKISESERTRNDASLNRHALPQPDLSRSTSVPEELSDEDDAPTVTTSPVYDSPECPPSGPRSPLARGGLLRPSSKEAQAQIVESGDENIVSYQRSDIQEELEVEVSSTFEDQHSERLLKLEEEDSLNSQEKLSASKHVSSSMSEEHRYSSSVSLEQDTEIKKRETSEAEEAEKSNIISSSKSHSAAVDLKTSPPLSYSSASSEHSCSPDLVAFSSKKGAAIKDVEVSSPIADGYHEDFESSADSSPREERHGSKPASQISVAPTEIKGLRKDSPSRATPYDSQDEEVDEEISEELSHHSGTSGASCQSGRLLDLHNHTDNSKHDSNDIVHSSRSPPISPLHTPLSPVIDEMPSFSIGDRVLVGSVQPGTLRFKGPTSFANGFWAGVELDKSEGSNNGTYDGIVYFKCDESHGIFAPPDKITHLPDKFEIYTDTTEDEDSFCDGMSDKDGEKRKTDEHKSQKQGNLKSENDQTSNKVYESGDKKVTEESVHKIGSHLNLQHYKESKHPICNGNTRDIMLDFEDAPTTLLISDTDKIDQGKQSLKEITAIVEREEVDSHQFSPADLSTDIRDDKGEQKDRDLLDTFADKLLNNFVKDTLTQFAEIKKAKEQKIEAANQMNGYLFSENVEQEEWFSSVQQKDGLPFFLPAEKEELSSPELCNRPESPVLGASGQEELAKRLAELELSRELLDELGEDQDWFDEDFGLSSRREQQRLKQREEEVRLGRSGLSAGPALGGLASSGGEQQVKTPPRPELPLPLPPKLPEQPAMVVPHSATEVEKMVHAATKEIWESCCLGKEGALILSQLPNPKPSQEYLGIEAMRQDQEALCVRSYRKAVYDLTWEMLQEIYAEDPSADQPQWVKPRRVKSSFFHRVKTPGDLTKIQEFISAEVLKLYGLTKDHSQKTDWQKMLKFGKKKRDRVDHILVQELHEEEAQWVNYDEDELFVKMQLADSIFDALLKDTANVLTLIYDKRAKRESTLS